MGETTQIPTAGSLPPGTEAWLDLSRVNRIEFVRDGSEPEVRIFRDGHQEPLLLPADPAMARLALIWLAPTVV